MFPVYAYLSSSVFKSYLRFPRLGIGSTVDFSAVLVVLILMLLGVMLAYLFRNTSWVEILNPTSVVYANTFMSSRNLSVVKIHNPFIFKLKNVRKSSLKKVTCTITSQCPCMIRAFWAVSVSDLNSLLYDLDWPSFKDRLSSLDFTVGIRDSNDCKKLFELNEEPLILTPTEELMGNDLGKTPRSKYPLVLFILRTDDNICSEDNLVAAMIVAVHVKDELCELDTVVTLHFLKQTNGQCSKLEPLYIANSESIDYASTPPVCVVCMNNAITHALLPCRHMCVCQNCFPMIDKCPMCRGHIQSYFCDT